MRGVWACVPMQLCIGVAAVLLGLRECAGMPHWIWPQLALLTLVPCCPVHWPSMHLLVPQHSLPHGGRAWLQVAGHVITRDLKQLIDLAVDTSKADYAVFTGVQIHSWPNPDAGEPILEYVQPVASYTVVNGQHKEMALNVLPPVAPRQLTMLAKGAGENPRVPEAMGYVQGTSVISMETITTMSA